MSRSSNRQAYLDVGLATAPPERLLTMLWDRLILDLVMAEEALVATDLSVANDRLVHAQDIVFELRASLRMDVWEGAAGLASLYAFVEEQLVQANVQKDPAAVATCRRLLEPLQQAFHEAAPTALAQRSTLATSA